MFGISTPKAVNQVGIMADGAIVGSALIDYMNEHGDDMPSAAARFVRYLKGESTIWQWPQFCVRKAPERESPVLSC